MSIQMYNGYGLHLQMITHVHIRYKTLPVFRYNTLQDFVIYYEDS